MSDALAPTPSAEDLLVEAVADCYADPLRFVLTCWDWPVNGEPGPDEWQRQFLEDLGAQVRERGFDGVHAVMPIRMGASSGHGIGKGALTAWIVIWIMATRPKAIGSITANTNDQLEKKTWSQIRAWLKTALVAHWFTINAEIMYRNGYREAWFCAPQSCAEENSEAFAGQHAKSSTSFYVNDEDSAVPDVIHEVEEGGLTDGQPMIFLFGNPTRNTGKFHEYAFGRGRDRWDIRVIDARTCRLPNKEQIQEWLEDYGEESDFFRVRVRGLPPVSNELQFIETELVQAAQARETFPLVDEPLIAGVDVSGGGKAWTVCRFRKGTDARSLPPIRIPGQKSRIEDRPRIVSVLAERLNDRTPERKIAAMFIDGAFGAVIVQRLNQMGYDHVFEVTFGAESPDPHQLNQRAYQWNKMKEWLSHGAIPKDDSRLATDLCAPGFHHTKKDQLVLESKESMAERGVASPDDGDALSLTFAQPVAIRKKTGSTSSYGRAKSRGWMG